MTKNKKEIIKRIEKTCACCGRKIKVILYKDKSYRGGHYFGKIPLHTKREFNKALKFGTRKERIGGLEIEVLKKDPKPYKHIEYWECPKCYWNKK
jgi:hypothetical protein